MFNILIKNITNKYEYNELIKIFLQSDKFSCFTEEEFYNYDQKEAIEESLIIINAGLSEDKNRIKREIFLVLSEITGHNPSWGILTGVRPVKLAGEILDKVGSEILLRKKLKETYLISDEKIDLLVETLMFQRKNVGNAPENSVGIYIGIPFCPTRCLYCSFSSNQVADDEISRYMLALTKEIQFVGKRMRETGLFPETIYVGGGTPTTLSEQGLENLLSAIEECIDISKLREFTVEAGRPDTITEGKLEVLKKHNITRISINPQSMKEDTLKLIGRSHTSTDIRRAFELTQSVGIHQVNADVICGLPKETPDDYKKTLKEVIKLEPQNITVHTLAVKRASKLIEVDKDFHYKQGETVEEMLEITKNILKKEGFSPYYLYRQKHMAGSFENVGYCQGNTPCIYNVRIMEEKQTIIAMGAGAISKVFYPDENRLERVPNVTNYEIYISRLEEMLDRKENNIFKEVN